jgi:aminoglycoside phosphotransferase (APT) family kinase protein
MRHGYLNSTERVPRGVRKSYTGPDARTRADTEFAALTRLAVLLPVPAVLDRHPDGSIVTEFRPGEHGQDLIDAGHAEAVLASCGALLRTLQSIPAGVLVPGRHPSTHVVVHGDFGPNNSLFDPDDHTVTALLDWEFSGVGPAIGDVAWCEWIVRMHHPAAVDSLPAFFAAYGERPRWDARQRAMVDRCRALEAFARRWDPPDEEGVHRWQERTRATAALTE